MKINNIDMVNVNLSKESTMKNHLNEVFEMILDSLPDDTYKNIVKNHTFIAGGAIRCLIDDSEINDYDVYFDSMSHAKWFTDTLEDKINSASVSFKKYHRKPPRAYLTNNALTLTIYPKGKPEIKVQFITRQSGMPEDVIGGFDFTNCMGYYFPKKSNFIILRAMYDSITSKRLVFNSAVNSYPREILNRRNKFITQGYTMSIEQDLKMMYKIAQTPLQDFFKTGYRE